MAVPTTTGTTLACTPVLASTDCGPSDPGYSPDRSDPGNGSDPCVSEPNPDRCAYSSDRAPSDSGDGPDRSDPGDGFDLCAAESDSVVILTISLH